MKRFWFAAVLVLFATRAPSFHVIDHIFHHSDADTLDLVPAFGIEAVARAYPRSSMQQDGDRRTQGSCCWRRRGFPWGQGLIIAQFN
jgi:hypothetical protein